MDEDTPNYRAIIQKPMDIATLLQRVDCGKYLNCSVFLQDIDLIAANAKAYNGDDYNGARIVSRAYELRDVVRSMLLQMDPSLISVCDKIAAQGGPAHVLDDIEGLSLPSTPVVQLAAGTRTRARLRNVQPEVNIPHDHEASRRLKKSTDNEQAGSSPEDKSRLATESESPRHNSCQPGPPHPSDANGPSEGQEEPPATELPEASRTTPASPADGCSRYALSDLQSAQVSEVKQRLMEHTEGFGVPQLEKLYTRMLKGALEARSGVRQDHTLSILKYLLEFVEDKGNF